MRHSVINVIYLYGFNEITKCTRIIISLHALKNTFFLLRRYSGKSVEKKTYVQVVLIKCGERQCDMSGQVNQAFEENQLDMLEDGRKSEPITFQNANCHKEKNPWAINNNAVHAYLSKHQRVFKTFGLIILNLLFITYIIFASIYWENQQRNCDFQWCEGYGLLLILTGLIYLGLFYFLIVKRYLSKYILQCCRPATNSLERLQNTKYGTRITAIIIYLVILIAIVIFLTIDTVNSRHRLISILGVIILVGLGWVFSKHPGQVNWKPVIWGLILQFILGLITLRWPVGRSIFQCVSAKVATFLNYAKSGSKFVFSEDIVNKGVFAFTVVPVIFFFNFIVQIMCYLGAMQWIIMKLGWILQSIMNTTLCESFVAVANPFIGMSESPLLIKPYLNQLTSSELHAVISSGFSTVSGTVLAAYISFGAKPAHLITASIMSAPTSLAYSKLFYPETEQSLTKSENIKLEKSSESSILDAATNGALAAIPIVLGIIANIVAFVSFIAFLNGILSWFGSLVGYEQLSLEIILAKIFMPLSWIMGVPWEHCEDVGMLIGMKTIVNELVAYQRMGELIQQGRIYGRSEAIATYAICGFANPSSIGIQVGLYSSLMPEKKEQVTKVVVRAFVTGSAVCFLTASIAGVLLDDTSVLSVSNNIMTMSNVTSTTLTSLI
ncbi:PREDICTED: solute carrier family 28 member 3 isoform X2 [Trachymyrmex cornetzi]|uniref:solute carrier family 28 member 3 isoform X2 n=1 Tax=Trachymyrmex cornetzi TaxID=471704 RepID=UPI00084F537C|nr:PREDICTED: solute carrier family 28 member 3 isoform X2 [Trachymyrmex cornetzi]